MRTPFAAIAVAIVRGFVRDKASLFFALVFPLMFLVLFGGLFADRTQSQVDLITVGDVPVLDELPPGAEEAFEETFDVSESDDLDEAIALSNDHRYALGASVFSRHHGSEIAEQLVCGQVTVNSVIAFAGMGAVPMGGVGASGFGRVHGDEGFAEFCRTRGRVRKLFGIPGFELVTLKRRRWVMPLIDRALSLRHRR